MAHGRLRPFSSYVLLGPVAAFFLSFSSVSCTSSILMKRIPSLLKKKSRRRLSARCWLLDWPERDLRALSFPSRHRTVSGVDCISHQSSQRFASLRPGSFFFWPARRHMLPTYVVRMPSHSSQSKSGGVNGGLAADADADVGHAYPPHASSTSAATTNRQSTAPKPIWRRVLGDRGITSLTVDVSAPAVSEGKGGRSDKASRSSPADVASAATSSSSSSSPRSQSQLHVQPSRWSTWEFRFYFLVFAIMVPLMVWVPIRLSLTSNPNYVRYSEHLRPGWLFGRYRDDSDFQYRSFRDYVPALAAIMGVYLTLGKLASKLPSLGGNSGSASSYRPLTSTASPQVLTEPRRNRRAFLSVFTVIFVLALHGANTVKLLAVLLINYAIAQFLSGRKWIAPAVIWSFNIGALAAVHWNDGFQWYTLANGQLAWLDKYNGLLPRWQINFNITMLRLVSYGLDLHWARTNASTTSPSLWQESDGVTDNRRRSSQSRPSSDYSLFNYLTYALYPPLFIAGPIISFNDFTSQLQNPPKIPTTNVLRYGVRFLFCLLTMEFILHFMYVNAIKDSKAWIGETPLELSMVGFWNLIIVWLKLLIPWRFFRLWSLADGVDPPENMVRCMANNYSTMGFWRSWHRSYNLWIVRYIYIPVGGARNTFGIPATLLVFTFVALWHDLSLKLLTWGWLVTLFILPEIVGKTVLCPQAKYGDRWWYRHVCALGGVFNVLLMMTANLVGFAIGLDGISYMWSQLLGSWAGVQFLLAACATLFVGVQAMFEYREEELRRGISRKC